MTATYGTKPNAFYGYSGKSVDENTDFASGETVRLETIGKIWIPMLTLTREQLEQALVDKTVQHLNETVNAECEVLYCECSAVPFDLLPPIPSWFTGGQPYEYTINIYFKAKGMHPALVVVAVVAVITILFAFIYFIVPPIYNWYLMNKGLSEFLGSDIGKSLGIILVLVIILIVVTNLLSSISVSRQGAKFGK